MVNAETENDDAMQGNRKKLVERKNSIISSKKVISVDCRKVRLEFTYVFPSRSENRSGLYPTIHVAPSPSPPPPLYLHPPSSMALGFCYRTTIVVFW